MKMTITKKKTKANKININNLELKENFENINDFEVEKNVNNSKVRKKSKEKIYFSKETEQAIIDYNNETCFENKNRIYEEKIKFSFEKLVENVFNTFKFTYFDTSPMDIQQETVSHLVSNIHKFKEGKGKAFSYFSIVAKHFLIFHNNNNYKRYNQHVSISETPSESEICLQTNDHYYSDVHNKELFNQLVTYWDCNVNKFFSKKNELKIANAVIELMRNIDRIEEFNKKMLYLYIREMTSCKTQQITKVVNKMKVYQKIAMKNYLNTGSVF